MNTHRSDYLKTALHSGGHPGYIEAVDEVVARIQVKHGEMADLLGDIEADQWARKELAWLQSECRDKIQEGAEIMGSTKDVHDEWESLLGGIGR